MAFCRSVGSVKTLVRIDSVAGNTKAAPSPMTARVAVSWPADPARADSPEPAAKIQRPTVRVPRRPNLSPMLPAVRSRPAKTST